MSKSSYARLRRFCVSVQQVLGAIREDVLFHPKNAYEISVRDDLAYIVRVLKRCREKTAYRRSTRMHMIAASVEFSTAVFCGKGVMSKIKGIRRHLSYILNSKRGGKYRHQDDLLLFLTRLRNNLSSRIASARRASR